MELQYLMNEMNKSLQGSSATGLNILTEEGLSQARSQVIIQQTLYSSILYIYSLFFKVTSHGESGPSRVCSVIRMLPQREVGAIKQFFGTSVRCSSWSAFGRLTGNNVSGPYKRHSFLFSLFLFFFFFFSVVYFSHRRSAWI